jgi:hypothetical protein
MRGIVMSQVFRMFAAVLVAVVVAEIVAAVAAVDAVGKTNSSTFRKSLS